MLKTLWRWLWRSIALVIILVLAYELWIFAHVWWYVDHNPGATAFMGGAWCCCKKNGRDAALKHRWVPYEKISINLKRTNRGRRCKIFGARRIRYRGDREGAQENEKKGKVVAGGSAISRIGEEFIPPASVPMCAKAEAIITLMLEQMMPKRRILEIYMNVIEWGEGVYGAEAAARHYYRSSAAGLSAYQAARLAAMVPRPRYFEKRPNSPYLARQAATIEARMVQVSVPK